MVRNSLILRGKVVIISIKLTLFGVGCWIRIVNGVVFKVITGALFRFGTVIRIAISFTK